MENTSMQSSQSLQPQNNRQISDGVSKSNPKTAEEIKAWMVSYLGQLLGVSPEEIDTTISFDRYGLDSAAAIGITGDLEDWLEVEVDPTALYDYPTIQNLSEHLASTVN